MPRETGEQVDAGDQKKATTPEALELDSLTEDLQSLLRDLKSVRQTVGGHSKSKIEAIRKKVADIARDLGAPGQTEAKEGHESASEVAHEAVQMSRDFLEKRPFSSVFTALLVGMGLGILLRRR